MKLTLIYYIMDLRSMILTAEVFLACCRADIQEGGIGSVLSSQSASPTMHMYVRAE